MFKSYGHKNVSILNGGLKKWKQNNFPLEKGDPRDIIPTFYKSNLTKKILLIMMKLKKILMKKNLF